MINIINTDYNQTARSETLKSRGILTSSQL